MLAYALRRLLISIPVLIASTFVVFLMASLSGNPLNQYTARNPPPPPEFIAQETERLGLNDPLLVRYWNWFTGLFQGDWGPSVISTMDIGSEITSRYLITLRLVAAAMIIAVILAIIVGVISAVKQYSGMDYVFTFTGFLFLAMPSFWFAILLKEAGISFNNAVGEQVLYTIGDSSINLVGGAWDKIADTAGHMVLPTISLALLSYAAWSRFQRSSMLEVLNSDYVRLARAKGLRRGQVMRKHALRTALIPLTTVTALDLGSIISGAVVTETVYQWRGAGDFLLQSIERDDVYSIMAWLVFSATIIIVLNLIADLLYGVLDPRIRYA